MTSTQREELCSECDEYATWYCVQDNANFCDEHNIVAHSLKSQKSHKTVPIDKKYVIIEEDASKPMNCKNHHMPLCLYCLYCKEVCCVACLSVDIHRQHSDQVKSVVDVANEERQILNEHLEKIQKLETAFIDEQNELEQAFRIINISEAESNEKIEREFHRIIACLEARRKVLEKQLQKKSKTFRDNIRLRQDDVKNIISSLNRYLEEGQRLLNLNDFTALSQSQAIIEKIKMLQMESVEYCNQTKLSNSLLFYISSQPILEMIDLLGSVGIPPAPLFVEQKCKANVTHLDIEWESVEHDPCIAAYVLEIGQNDDNFKEVYRGLETKCHLPGLHPNTLYSLSLYACLEGEIGNTVMLEMRTLNIDLNDWTLSMSSTYPASGSENTRESLLDEQLITGATTNHGAAWIKASFPYPVLVQSVTIAPLHKNPSTWGPTNGTDGSLQYSHDNINWTTVGTIAYVLMQKQKIVVGDITARYWRLFHNSYLGTSSFVFQ